MMNTATINRNVLTAIRADLDAAIAAVAAKHGVSMKTGSARFSSAAATMKVEIATISATGEVISKTIAALRANYKYLGLTEDHLNATFSIAGRTYKLAGYNSRRYAKPFEIKCLDNGKIYVTTEAQIHAALGIPAKISQFSSRF
jgi:hypothetical protein